MPHPADFVPGAQWTAKSTSRNQKNDIPAQARTWITFATGDKISIYVDKGMGMKFHLDRETMTANFTKEMAMAPNQAYVGRQHATKAYS